MRLRAHTPLGRRGVRPTSVFDDATCVAYLEVLGDGKGAAAVGLLRRAIAFERLHGIEAERVMTDNGWAYISVAHALGCMALGIGHIRAAFRSTARTSA